MEGTPWPWIRESLRTAAWAPLLVLATHVIAQQGLHAYQRIPQFDIPMHLIGGMAIGFFLIRSLELSSARSVIGTLTPFGHALLVISAVAAVAVAWEFLEWGLRLTQRHVGWSMGRGTLNDTLLDLAVGLVGGGVALVVDRCRVWR